MGLLPWTANVLPTDKIALGSFMEDVEEMLKKTVDPVSGRVFYKNKLNIDLEENEKKWR